MGRAGVQGAPHADFCSGAQRGGRPVRSGVSWTAQSSTLPWPCPCPGHTPTSPPPPHPQSQPPAANWEATSRPAFFSAGGRWEWWVGSRLGSRAPGLGALRFCSPPSLHTLPLHAGKMIKAEGGADDHPKSEVSNGQRSSGRGAGGGGVPGGLAASWLCSRLSDISSEPQFPFSVEWGCCS